MSQRWLLRGIQSQFQNYHWVEEFENVRKPYWPEDWGPVPSTSEEALAIVERLFLEAPVLIPVYVHRFMPTEPTFAGNPVFSIMDTDIIHYGPNLTTYFINEFGHLENTPLEAASRPNPIRFWDDYL